MIGAPGRPLPVAGGLQTNDARGSVHHLTDRQGEDRLWYGKNHKLIKPQVSVGT